MWNESDSVNRSRRKRRIRMGNGSRWVGEVWLICGVGRDRAGVDGIDGRRDGGGK